MRQPGTVPVTCCPDLGCLDRLLSERDTGQHPADVSGAHEANHLRADQLIQECQGAGGLATRRLQSDTQKPVQGSRFALR